jgi:hypothetical protein
VSGIRRIQAVTFEIDPVDVDGYPGMGRPGGRYRAEFLTAALIPGTGGKVTLWFEGRRYLTTRPGELTRHRVRFQSDDRAVAEAKLAARRIAAAAAHKATGDTAGRRAS